VLSVSLRPPAFAGHRRLAPPFDPGSHYQAQKDSDLGALPVRWTRRHRRSPQACCSNFQGTVALEIFLKSSSAILKTLLQKYFRTTGNSVSPTMRPSNSAQFCFTAVVIGPRRTSPTTGHCRRFPKFSVKTTERMPTISTPAEKNEMKLNMILPEM
jgi:hypothetical protein